MSETVVFTRDNRHEPETVVKHTWGVVMFLGGEKVSLPWHMIQEIREEIPESDRAHEFQDHGAIERIY